MPPPTVQTITHKDYKIDDYSHFLLWNFKQDNTEIDFGEHNFGVNRSLRTDECLPFIFGLLAAPENKVSTGSEQNLKIIEERIQSLMDEDEELKPSVYAHSKALSLVYEIVKGYDGVFPKAAVATGEDEGIYIYWKQKQSLFELRIPSSPSSKLRVYINTDSSAHSYMVHVSEVQEIRNLLMVFERNTTNRK